MATSLHVLIVEDSAEDAQLVLRELQRGGYKVEHERVETRAAMQEALSRSLWDLVLCDYTLPQFSAMDALATLKASRLDLPFIVISGTIDEASSVTALKAGAHDFMVKGRLARLLPAIERELRDVETRRAHRESEADREKLITKLEATNAELERFMYTAFHDLKAPLVTIKGFLGMLNSDIRTNRQDQIQKDIQRIAGAADKMAELLSDLLELSRIGRVIHPPEEIDLFKLTQEALETLDARIRSKNVAVKISPDLPIVYGDRIRLREVLENLIDNAAKYTGNQQNPIIEIGAREQDGQQIIFVKDNGLGIDSRYHTRIFNLFERLNPTMEGTGLGLTLIKRIVELHGGKVWVESKGEGQGAMFCFTIPHNRTQ